jgi:hypothetical protein
MAAIASIALGFLCVGFAGCANQAFQAYRPSSLNTDPPKGRLCLVNDQSCLSMMAEPARPCLTAMQSCTRNGEVLTLDLTEKAY